MEPPTQDPFTFYWHKPIQGEVQLESRIDEDEYLTGTQQSPYGEVFERIPVPESEKDGPWLRFEYPPWGRYWPMGISNLHRRFARAGQDERGILRFAAKYGPLGHGLFLISPKWDGGNLHDRRPVARYEALTTWRREVAIMDRLIEVWDLIKKKDASKLGRWVHWGDYYTPEHRNRVIWDDMGPDLTGGPGTRRDVLGLEGSSENGIPREWQFGDIIQPAYYYVCVRVNERLHSHVEPYILPLHRGDILFLPDCLLSAMYAQFALEVSGKIRPAIVCQGCGKYFNPDHGAQRYCEETCRKRKWWRDRKGNAIKLEEA